MTNYSSSADVLDKYTYITQGDGSLVLTQTDWLGNTTTYTYDPLGRLIKVVDPYGTILEQLYYNDNDCQILSVDACGNQTVFEYDKNNRLISTTDEMLNKSGSVYDRAGLLVSEYDGNGNTVNYAYDELGRLVSTSKTVNNIDETVSYTYDNRGNLTSQTNGEGHTTTYVYNIADKLASKIDHNGAGDSTKTENYTYDERGNLVSKTDRNGQTLTYVYDVHNRLTDTKYGDDILISNTYDNNGNIVTTVDQSGTTIRTFDSLNRTLTENISDIGTKTYQYDITDNIDSGYVMHKITDPYNNVTVKIFDKNGRLYMVKSAENAQPISYDYNANGTVSKITNTDGTYTQYVYNADNTIAEMTNYSSSADVLDKYTYTYDCAKNQISKTEVISGVSVGTTTFAYDEANRLVSVTEPSGKITQYTYDKVGNRVKQSVTENDITVDTIYTYNEQERLMNSTSTANNVTYQICYNYDNNGNLFSKTQNIIKPYSSEVPDVVLSVLGVDAESDFDAVYEYNVLNQLVNVYQGDTTITNTYNGDGLRVSQTINGDTTKYVYDQGNVICEVNNGNIFRNVFGLRLHLREEDGNTYTYRYNGHGDVMVVTSGDGTTVATYYYDPFGVEISSAQSIHNPYRYCGEYYDSDTGLIYLRARYYDPSVGRFISEDPIRDGLNWYVYCDNNPVMYVDPFGLESVIFVANGMEEQAEIRQEFYTEKYGTNSYVIIISSPEDFVDKWNQWFSVFDEFNVEIDAIEIISHGSIEGKVGKDSYGTAYSTGYIYFDDKDDRLYARNINGISDKDRSLEELISVNAKEMNISSCNSANKDTYNVLYGFMQRVKAEKYSGFDGGAQWDPKLGDHIDGGGDYDADRPWYMGGPWYYVKRYQYTWWKYVDKQNGVPVREREGRRYFQ